VKKKKKSELVDVEVKRSWIVCVRIEALRPTLRCAIERTHSLARGNQERVKRRFFLYCSEGYAKQEGWDARPGE
jgi:hypothetical protein